METGEGLLYNQDNKKDSSIIRQGGKTRNQIRPCTPGRELKGTGRLHGWRFNVGSKLFEPQFGTAQDLTQGRQALLTDGRTTGANESCGKPQLSMRSMCMLAYQQGRAE